MLFLPPNPTPSSVSTKIEKLLQIVRTPRVRKEGITAECYLFCILSLSAFFRHLRQFSKEK